MVKYLHVLQKNSTFAPKFGESALRKAQSNVFMTKNDYKLLINKQIL
jgi:hypothetical protein